MTAETKPEISPQPGLTITQCEQIFELYVSARNAASLAARFPTSQKFVDSHAADKKFTDALTALVIQ